MKLSEAHFVNDRRLQPPFPATLERALFALSCFRGEVTERTVQRDCEQARLILPAALR
jgi:hypothetical protein